MALKGSGLNTGVEPVFILDKDIPNQGGTVKTRPYELCIAASNVIGRPHVLGAQNIRGLWRIYCDSRDKRLELIVKGLSMRGKTLPLFEKNPRTTNTSDPNQKVEKITVRELPVSVSDEEVKSFLESKGVHLTSDIRVAKERDDDGELTSFFNGDRYVYAMSPVQPVLPFIARIAEQRCRIFHASQQNTCTVCGTLGHRAKGTDCPAYTDLQEIETVVSYQNPLSNMYMGSPIEYQDKVYKSVEHAYQALKAESAGMYRLAEEICQASHAGIAKALGKKVPESSTWDGKRVEIMTELLSARAQCDRIFRHALIDTGDTVIAHTVRDSFWGCGLPPALTKVTQKSYWPGSNMHGALLMDLRRELGIYSTPEFEDPSAQASSLELQATAQQQEFEDSLAHAPSSHLQAASQLQNRPPSSQDTPQDAPKESLPQEQSGNRGRAIVKEANRRAASPSPTPRHHAFRQTRGNSRTPATRTHSVPNTPIDIYMKRKPSGTPPDGKPLYKQAKANTETSSVQGDDDNG